MVELVQENWLLLVLALLVGVMVAWWVLVASRRTRVEIAPRDEDAPAKSNQALIDAPPAATQVGAPPVGAEPPPAAPAGDDLTRIKGLGPKLVEQLREFGVIGFAQIAAWDDAEIDRIDARLGRFQGRIRRDDWRGQAALLSAGDTAGYETKFGKL